MRVVGWALGGPNTTRLLSHFTFPRPLAPHVSIIRMAASISERQPSHSCPFGQVSGSPLSTYVIVAGKPFRCQSRRCAPLCYDLTWVTRSQRCQCPADQTAACPARPKNHPRGQSTVRVFDPMPQRTRFSSASAPRSKPILGLLAKNRGPALHTTVRHPRYAVFRFRLPPSAPCVG